MAHMSRGFVLLPVAMDRQPLEVASPMFDSTAAVGILLISVAVSSRMLLILLTPCLALFGDDRTARRGLAVLRLLLKPEPQARLPFPSRRHSAACAARVRGTCRRHFVIEQARPVTRYASAYDRQL